MSVKIPGWIINPIPGLSITLWTTVKMLLSDYCSAIADLAGWYWRTDVEDGTCTPSGDTVVFEAGDEYQGVLWFGAGAGVFKGQSGGGYLFGFDYSSSLPQPASVNIAIKIFHQDGTIEIHYDTLQDLFIGDHLFGSWTSGHVAEPCCPPLVLITASGYSDGAGTVTVSVSVIPEG